MFDRRVLCMHNETLSVFVGQVPYAVSKIRIRTLNTSGLLVGKIINEKELFAPVLGFLDRMEEWTNIDRTTMKRDGRIRILHVKLSIPVRRNFRGPSGVLQRERITVIEFYFTI